VNTWEFAELQERLGALARENPKRFRRELFWFVMLGYLTLGACLGFVLLFAALGILGFLFASNHPGFGPIATIVGTQLLSVTVIGVFLRFVVRLARQRPAEVGVRIRSEDCPQLYHALKESSRRLGAPRVNEIKIYGEINAKAHLEGLLSFAGLGQPVLYLGAPLVAFLSHEQVKTVIAHEVAHFAEGHAKFGWFYGVRYLWTALRNVVVDSKYYTTGHAVRLVLPGVKPFVLWYFPRLQARYNVVNRMFEVVADANVTNLFDERVYGSALLQLAVLQWLDAPLNNDLARQARRTGVVPSDVVRQRIDRLRERLDTFPAKGAVWLALGREARGSDTHPSLSERLAQCGLPVDRRDSAVLQNLVDLLHMGSACSEHFVNDALLRELDGHISALSAEHWATMSAEMRNFSRRLRFLEEQRIRPDGLTQGGAWERLQLIGLFGPEERYRNEIIEFHKQYPADPQGRLLFELQKLEAGDSSAVRAIEDCVQQVPGFAQLAAEKLEVYYAKQLCFDEAHKQTELRQVLTKRAALSVRERNLIRTRNTFVSASLTGERRGEIASKLAEFSVIRRAYLVAKVVDEKSGENFDLMGLRLSSRWRIGSSRHRAQLQELREIIRPLPVVVVILEKKYARLEPIFERVPGAELPIRQVPFGRLSGRTRSHKNLGSPETG